MFQKELNYIDFNLKTLNEEVWSIYLALDNGDEMKDQVGDLYTAIDEAREVIRGITGERVY